MGLRFRKSIKIAPGLKLNLNKKSVSVTAGTKGAHYTMSSTGKKTASVGIPGTGISYTETSSSGKSGSDKGRSSQNGSGGKKKARGCLIAVLALLAIYMFGGLYSIFWIPAFVALIVFIARKKFAYEKTKYHHIGNHLHRIVHVYVRVTTSGSNKCCCLPSAIRVFHF